MKNKIKFTLGIIICVVCVVIVSLCSCGANPKYTITWTNYDGTILEVDINVDKGTMPFYDGTTPVKPGNAQYTYTFSGWSPEVTSVTEDKTYIAEYTNSTNTYTITWKNYDGSILETDVNVAYGSTPSYNGVIPKKPTTRDHSYLFKGWDKLIENVCGNQVYIAVFDEIERNEYMVSYNSNGGSVVDDEDFCEYGAGVKIINSIPTKSDYSFVGWMDILNGELYSAGDLYKPKCDVTLYAAWNANCSECEGNGSITLMCNQSNGTGVEGITNCYNCNGTGVIINENNCTKCSGSGQIYLGYNFVSCSICEGLGGIYEFICGVCSSTWRTGQHTGYCWNCNSSLYTKSFKGTCIRCNGSGKVKIDHYNTCTSCGGSGKGSGSSSYLECRTCSGSGTTKIYCNNCAGEKTIISDCKNCNGIGHISSFPIAKYINSTYICFEEEGENIEYSIDGINWQRSALFKNLTPSTQYVFYKRINNIDGIEYGYWGDGVIVETSIGAEGFYEFDSWYSDSELTNKVEGTDDEMQNMTLYAGYNFTGKIYYASDLEQINNSLLGQNFVLMNDIVVSNFDGIGDSDSAFNGQFNGNGFKISGLTTPLFKSLGSSAVVTNLLIDVNISSTENYAGAFCEILNGGIISNCRSTGSISSKYYSGGIAAVMNGGTIENCSTAVNIKSTTYAGGIVAVLKDGTISSCSFNGEIIANANSSSKCNIEESNYNERYFTGSYSEIQYIYTKYTYTYSCYIGGIVAQKEKGEIIDCSNSGSFVKNCSINTETKELTDKKSGSYPLIENGDKHTMSYTYFYYEIILKTYTIIVFEE